MDPQDHVRTALADRYALEGEIGSGGMATVYRAADLKHHRTVAIKVLKPEMASVLGPERFLREIEVTAALRHPHILPLLDSGLAGELPFYVMPYVEGESLRQRLARERQLPIEDALKIAREVADALGYAHGHDVVHRDIKPENILLESGHAVVADFGVARAVVAAGSERLTQTGMVVGTPGYLSPEQAMGEGEVDGRSDIYSLGCVLYEMLAGQPPITGPTAAAVMARKVTETAAGVRSLRSTVPPELERVLTRALAVVPADRQRTAGELTEELEAVPRGLGASVSRPRRGRSPTLLGFAGLAAVVLTAVLVVWRGLGTGGAVTDEAASRVVVLPYENRTGDPALDAVGQMAADWITEGLARTAEVSVVPSAMVLEAGGGIGAGSGRGEGEGLIRRVAEITQAGLAVTGSYYLRGQELEFHSEILEVSSGRPLMPVDPVLGPVADPGAAIDSVRVQVMGALASRLNRLISWEPLPSRPPTYEAFQAYAQGMEDYIRGDFASAAEGFDRAYALDTTYLRSLIIRSGTLQNAARDSLVGILSSRRGELSPYDRARVEFLAAGLRGDRAAALAAARAGVELAPVGTLSFALIWTLIFDNRPGEARDRIERAFPPFARLEPPWYDLWVTHDQILHLLGEYEQGLQTVREGLGRIPSNLFLMEAEGRELAALGRRDEALELAEDILLQPVRPGINPGGALETLAEELRGHGDAEASADVIDLALAWLAEQPEAFRNSPAGRTLLGSLLYLREEWAAAGRIFEPMAADSASVVLALGYLGCVAARQGDRETAVRLSEELAQLGWPYMRGSNTLRRARISALLGDRDAAVQLLRRAFSEGLGFGFWVHTDPDLESLRGYEPYEALLRPKG